MSKKPPKRQPKRSADSLLKTGRKGAVELTEQELTNASGGCKWSPASTEKYDPFETVKT